MILLLAFSSGAFAESVSMEVPVGSGGRLVFVHPSAWETSLSGPRLGPTLEMSPGATGDFSVLVTAIPWRNGRPMTDEELKERVLRQGTDLLPTALQTELTLVDVGGEQAKGYLYHLTDRNPEQGPGDYRELHQGAVLVGPYLLSVTVLTHPGDSAAIAGALTVLGSATYEAPTGRR